MYSLDKDFRILPTRTEIIDLDDYKVDEQYAAFNRLDIDFKIPRSYGKVLVNTGIEQNFEIKDLNIDRISVEFSGLESDREILDFSKKYGLLGLGKATQNMSFLDDRRELHLYIGGFSYEATYVEPLKLWHWHVKHVKKLLQLARALSKLNQNKKAEIEENILYIADPPIPPKLLDEVRNEDFPYKYVYWYDHEYTTVDILSNNYSFKKVAMYVLVKNITSMLKQAVNIDPDGFIEDKSSKYGFKIRESRSTNFLLAAIYYDLWQMLAKEEPIKVCQYIKCRKPFRAVGRKKFCSDSCRVREFNRLKGENDIG